VLLLSAAWCLELGRVKVRGDDLLIPVRGTEYVRVEVLNPPEVKGRVGPNLDPGRYSGVYRFSYVALCYGDVYYRDERRDVRGTLRRLGEIWAVDLSALPESEGYRLLPARLCVCFSDRKLNSIDALNTDVEEVCAANVTVWVNYSHERFLREIGFRKGELLLRVRVRSTGGAYRDAEIRIVNPAFSPSDSPSRR